MSDGFVVVEVVVVEKGEKGEEEEREVDKLFLISRPHVSCSQFVLL